MFKFLGLNSEQEVISIQQADYFLPQGTHIKNTHKNKMLSTARRYFTQLFDHQFFYYESHGKPGISLQCVRDLAKQHVVTNVLMYIWKIMHWDFYERYFVLHIPWHS